MSREVIAMVSAISAAALPVLATATSAYGQPNADCVTLYDQDGSLNGWNCDGVFVPIVVPSPAPPPSPPAEPGDGGDAPEPGREETDDDVALDEHDDDGSSDGAGIVEPSDVDADSSVEAPGGEGATGVAPPSCVERALRRRGMFVNTVDDTGRSGIVYVRRCADGNRQTVVRAAEPVPPDDTGRPLPPPPPDPQDLADELYGQMIVMLPSPTVHIAPADLLEQNWAWVQHPAFFWIDEWSDLSSTLTVGPVSVTLTVIPQRVDVDLGNGDQLSCVDPPAFTEGTDPRTFNGCEYVYRHSSAMAPNGESWPVKVSMVWSASWSSNVGVSGSFGEAYTTSARDLQVAESQAIITG